MKSNRTKRLAHREATKATTRLLRACFLFIELREEALNNDEAVDATVYAAYAAVCEAAANGMIGLNGNWGSGRD